MNTFEKDDNEASINISPEEIVEVSIKNRQSGYRKRILCTVSIAGIASLVALLPEVDDEIHILVYCQIVVAAIVTAITTGNEHRYRQYCQKLLNTLAEKPDFEKILETMMKENPSLTKEIRKIAREYNIFSLDYGEQA